MAVWVVSIGLASVLLTGYIVRFIKSKPLLSVTLVDLIYCDVLCWLSVGVIMYLSAILVCHLSPRFVLFQLCRQLTAFLAFTLNEALQVRLYSVRRRGWVG